MVHITNTTQFTTFETIRTIILNNATLKVKFNKSNIFEYGPSKTQFSLPHILIDLPETSKDDETLGSKPTYSKNFDIQLSLRIGYEARDKVLTYVNALIYAIENDTTMLALGYHLEEVSNTKPNMTDMYDVNIIETIFTISYKGDISYG